jgi:hypothetical protein
MLCRVAQATWRNIPEDTILHSHRRKNLKSYTVLLTVRFLDVEKFTSPIPLSLLISFKLSSPIVGLKMSFLPTLVLKSPNRIFVWYLGNLSNSCSSPCRNCPSRQFCPLLGHEHVEQ